MSEFRYSQPVQVAVSLLQRPFDAEWTENPLSWPHCNGQARCWMHYSSETRWCGCSCRWCRIARRVRPGLRRRADTVIT